jgi:hypothetical protein
LKGRQPRVTGEGKLADKHRHQRRPGVESRWAKFLPGWPVELLQALALDLADPLRRGVEGAAELVERRGKAAIKTGKSGDGNAASPGFAMAGGQLCQLEVQLNNLTFGSPGAQTITSD